MWVLFITKSKPLSFTHHGWPETPSLPCRVWVVIIPPLDGTFSSMVVDWPSRIPTSLPCLLFPVERMSLIPKRHLIFKHSTTISYYPFPPSFFSLRFCQGTSCSPTLTLSLANVLHAVPTYYTHSERKWLRHPFIPLLSSDIFSKTLPNNILTNKDQCRGW